MDAWQLLQLGLLRCSARRWRMDRTAAPGLLSILVSTPGGGGVIGNPRMLFRSHFPRRTGEVRSGYDVVASSAPCASRPPRWFGFVSVTRRKRLPYTPGIPY